jgi:glycosyltransferase involved in cell wall biosynthesis
MFAGRMGDPNKRSKIAADALRILGVDSNLVVTTGTDFAPYGDFAGVVKGDVLNDLYNSIRFVLFPSRFEGLGLPAFEALAAGKIPVICNDLNVRQEFFPSNLFPEYDEVNPDSESVAKFIAKYSHEENYLELSGRLNQYWKQELKERFSNKGVAERIIKVYESI